MNTLPNNAGYKQTLLGERRRLANDLTEARSVYHGSPQLLAARQRGPAPDVYFHFRRKAKQARIGAYAMWMLCLTLGGSFTILAYNLSWLPPLISGLIVFAVWAAVTVMIGIGVEKIVQFGLDVQSESPDSVHKAVRGILICGGIFLLSFAGLLLLRSLVSLPLLIAIQAVFEIAAICAGSMFKAIEQFYGELPDLRDRITNLEAAIDKIDAQIVMLDSDHDYPVARQPMAPALQSNQHIGVTFNVPPSVNGHPPSGGLPTHPMQETR